MAAEFGNDTAVPRAAPDDARCPRCGRDFHCGMNDATPCACSTLRLSAATLSELRARHRGCLCLQCLRALADDGAPAPADAMNADRPTGSGP